MGQPPVGELDGVIRWTQLATATGAQGVGPSLLVRSQWGLWASAAQKESPPAASVNPAQILILSKAYQTGSRDTPRKLPSPFLKLPSSRPLLVLTELIGSPLSLGAMWLWSQSLPRCVTTRLQDCTGATVPLKHLPLDDTNSCCHLEKHFVDLAFGPLVP